MDAFFNSKLKLHIFNKKYFVHSINLNIFMGICKYGIFEIWKKWKYVTKNYLCEYKVFFFKCMLNRYGDGELRISLKMFSH